MWCTHVGQEIPVLVYTFLICKLVKWLLRVARFLGCGSKGDRKWIFLLCKSVQGHSFVTASFSIHIFTTALWDKDLSYPDSHTNSRFILWYQSWMSNLSLFCPSISIWMTNCVAYWWFMIVLSAPREFDSAIGIQRKVVRVLEKEDWGVSWWGLAVKDLPP